MNKKRLEELIRLGNRELLGFELKNMVGKQVVLEGYDLEEPVVTGVSELHGDYHFTLTEGSNVKRCTLGKFEAIFKGLK